MISIGSAKGASKARESVANANTWYARREILNNVRDEAVAVREWLVLNKHKTGKKGEEISESWWPSLDQTDNDDRLDLRRTSLRMLVYGHGLRRLLNRMVASGLLGREAMEVIDSVTDFSCMAFHDELLGYELSTGPQPTVSLVDLRDRFGLSHRTNPTKMRDGLVLRMASLGLWKVQIDAEGRYAIRLGPVAKIFHEEVFSSVRKSYESKLGG